MIFRKVVASPMSFFDVTPSGQVMNRFSKDMDESECLDILYYLAGQVLVKAFFSFDTLNYQRFSYE